MLQCRQKQAAAALDVHSNVRLHGLSIHASRSACVQHHSGCLRITDCRLECNPQRFDHLYCALVTLVRGQNVSLGESPGMDSLTVEATVISGSLRAVQCVGDGALQDVRVCFEGRQKLFWFNVAAQQSCMPHSMACSVAARIGATSAAEVPESEEADAILQQRSMERKRQRLCEYGRSVRQHCV